MGEVTPFTLAPLFTDVAPGPLSGHAFWLTTQDGLRLRAGLWPQEHSHGTVFLLPGRTEYVEKYGPAAQDLAQRGYTTLCLDWRGQGLSDRPFAPHIGPREKGHITAFGDYQLDLSALIAAAAQLALPRPWHLLTHSMAGAIGLRRLLHPHPFASAAFSAPMWGVGLPVWLRPFGGLLADLLAGRRCAQAYVPGTAGLSYLNRAPFAQNLLTRDADMWAMMLTQVAHHPELSLAGPSFNWAAEAIKECRALAGAAAPDLPAYVSLGSAERVIDPAPIHARMAHWLKGQLELPEGVRHEVMMEDRATRSRFFDSCARLFQSAR